MSYPAWAEGLGKYGKIILKNVLTLLSFIITSVNIQTLKIVLKKIEKMSMKEIRIVVIMMKSGKVPLCSPRMSSNLIFVVISLFSEFVFSKRLNFYT